MQQTQISILFYLIFILYSCLGFFCLFLNKKEQLNQVFFWLCMSYAVWAFGFAISNTLSDVQSVLIWRRIAALGWGVAFSVMLHFMLILTEHQQWLGNLKIRIAIYLPAVITIAVFALFPQLADAQYNLVQTPMGWGNIPVNNFWDIFYNLYYLSFSLLTLGLLFQWYRSTPDRRKQQQAFWLLLAFAIAIALGTLTEMMANNLLAYPIPSVAPIIILIPVTAFTFDIKKYKLMVPENSDKKVKFSEILSDDTHRGLFRSMAMTFVVISVIGLGNAIFFNLPLWRLMAVSTIDLVLGLFIYSLPFSGLSIANQDRMITALMAVAIPLSLFRPGTYLTNVVWAVPLIFLSVTIVFKQKRMFILLATVTVISGLVIVLWKSDQWVNVGTREYLARLFICLVAILLAGYTNRIYIARLTENNRQISFQKMISQVTTQFVSVSASNFDEKVQYLLKTSGEIMNADRVFVGRFFQDSGELRCTNEWLAEPYFPSVNLNEDIRQTKFPWFTKTIFNNQLVYLRSCDELPAEAQPEKAMMVQQGITAMLLIPIQSRETIIGFLGFDKIGKAKVPALTDPELLRVLANTLADAIGKVENENEIHCRAYYDTLTGLPNRVFFHEQLEKSMAAMKSNGSQLGVIFVDLDGFKEVNDTMGHDWGDHLLNHIGQRLSDNMRKGDSLARFGGDEFLIMVSQLNHKNELLDVARQLMAVFKEPVCLGEQEFYISASGGIAVFPEDGETVSALIKHADLAMYDAKKNGKGQVVFCSEEMKNCIREKMILTNSLHRALERQQLALYYQPKFDVSSQTMVGCEALLRWQHPELGMILPGVFIPIAEQKGLMSEIGQWVFKTACAQNKAWQAQGFRPLPVAVNLSAAQFDNDLTAIVEKCLTETGLAGQYLELEITETIAMAESCGVILTLHQLKALGLGISIDDFGTEFSSLSRLNDLPVDRIKIDGSFIWGIGVNPKDESIISVMIHLAQKLGLLVVAEGVESQAQLAFLQEKGCHEVQGYYWGEPMTAADFEKQLSRVH